MRKDGAQKASGGLLYVNNCEVFRRENDVTLKILEDEQYQLTSLLFEVFYSSSCIHVLMIAIYAVLCPDATHCDIYLHDDYTNTILTLSSGSVFSCYQLPFHSYIAASVLSWRHMLSEVTPCAV